MGFHACRCWLLLFKYTPYKKIIEKYVRVECASYCILLLQFFCWSDGLGFAYFFKYNFRTHCRIQNRKETSCAGCLWKVFFFCILNLTLTRRKILNSNAGAVQNEKLYKMMGLSKNFMDIECIHARKQIVYKKEEIYLIVIK